MNRATFIQIKARECMGDFDGPNAEKESPNLYAMRRQFDAIKGWTIGEVGKNKDPLSRLKTVWKIWRCLVACTCFIHLVSGWPLRRNC